MAYRTAWQKARGEDQERPGANRRARNGPKHRNIARVLPELGRNGHKGRGVKARTAKAGERPKGQGERPERNAKLMV